MITAVPLEQEPRPAMVGERVNSQGSRKAKELLLADDYDGLVQVAEDQVEGGAHVLDVCVALTERQDEDEQMRQVVKRVSLTQPTPIQIDSTEPDVIKDGARADPGPRDRQLDQPRGRPRQGRHGHPARDGARRRADRAHDRRGRHGQDRRPQGRDRQAHPRDRLRRARARPRAADLRRPHVHAHHRRRGVAAVGGRDDRGHPPVKEELPGVKTSLGVSNVSFGVGPARPRRAELGVPAPRVEAGLDLAMVNPNHITPYGEISEEERELADDLVFNRARGRAREVHRALRVEGRGGRPRRRPTPPPTWSPRRRSTGASCSARRKGSRTDIDRPVEKIGAVRRAERRAAAGDEGGRRQVRRRRADPAVRPPVRRGHEARRRPAREVPGQDRGLHEGHGRARDRLRRRARHRQVARQHDPDEQRLHGRATWASRSRSARSWTPPRSTRPPPSA